MLISYEPNSDVLSLTVQAGPAVQTQMQGTVSVGFDAAGQVVAVSIPNASSVLWEQGGQVSILLPTPSPAAPTMPVAPTVVRETTTIIEQP